jgi:thiosulfate dehydrogenase
MMLSSHKQLFSAVLIVSVIVSACNARHDKDNKAVKNVEHAENPGNWPAPDTSQIPDDEFGKMVRYGRSLVINTAYYIGPEGKVSHNLGNKMNCTNCHLDGGTKPFAFNYLSSHARYPQYRARENRILSLSDRVNNCIERPHNGKPLKLDSREMTAFICYIKWLGQNVPVNQHVPGDSQVQLALMDRAADPLKGEVIYKNECKSCHGENGEGKMLTNGLTYEYPPLWGLQSYQPGSSMHRVHKAAGFIYANMPNKNTTIQNPKLTVEQAFDVAAFINDDRIHLRPDKKGIVDYANSLTKPIDYPVGPFVDPFPEHQHKFGPWKPIIDYRKAHDLPAQF